MTTKPSYDVEFLGPTVDHAEADLSELSRDDCIVSWQYPAEVGNQDVAIDLAFFHEVCSASWPQRTTRSSSTRSHARHRPRSSLGTRRF
jgi:hypothetical protein